MPGTQSNQCEFVGCEYRREGDALPTGAQFQQPPDMIGTTDDGEWMLHFYSGYNDFEIWDVNPLP